MIQDDDPSTPIEQMSPMAQALVVLALGLPGTALSLHSVGWARLGFLHPNPQIGAPVFGIIGAFLLCAALIAALKALKAPRWTSDAAGWSTVATGFVLLNWLVLPSRGQAACFIGQVPSLALGVYGSLVCDWLARVAVVICDIVAALMVVTIGLKWLRPKAPL